MAKPTTLIFSIATALDGAKLNSDLTTMRDTIKKYPVKINIDVASETGKSLTEKLGGGEQFFNMVQQSVGSVGKLKTEYSLFADAAGKAIKIATSETKEYRDETGNVIREVISLKTEEQALAEAIKQGGTAKTGTASAESNLRKQAELTEVQINKEITATINNTKAAEKYLEKSKNMRGPQVEAAKKAAQAVIDEGKALQKASPLAKDFGDKVEAARKANDNFKVSLEGVKTGANVFQNFSSRITNAIQQTIAYSFSIGLVYKAQQLLNDSVKYAIDLNTEMTKIQVLQAEGAKTPEEINTLANSFNKLGQEMGVSTLEIAKGSVEWFRQGRTVEETQKLMKASMMLSKLGAMESADATNYLTSITNAFKISVGDTTSVVDKLIAVDNIAATSAGELATALRYTSESAALAGVGMEQLISYIGTVSTVTRQNAEMIGQAFKTMFARMTLIQGGGTDEEGWTISKVEKALTAVGIEMKKADGTFRNMGDVLEDTAAKWDTLGERERIEIAVAIGGVRQKEAFLVLMDNMDKALQYQAAQYDANGLAMDRYGIYMESIQAKQGKLTASMQELYASVVNSKMISAFYDIAIGMVQTITQGHLLIPILSTILYLMWAINREAIQGKWTKWTTIIGGDLSKVTTLFKKLATTISVAAQVTGKWGQASGLLGFLKSIPYGANVAGFQVAGLTAKLSALGGVLSTIGPYLIALVPLLVAGIGWSIHKKQVEGATKAVEEFITTQKELRQSNTDVRASVAAINELMDKKRKTVDWDAEGAAQLADEFERLQSILPTLDWKWMDGRPYLTQKIDLDALNESLGESVEITEDQSHAIYIQAQENIRNYSLTKWQYDEELELLRMLEEAKKRFKAAGGGDAGLAAANEYIKGLKEGMSTLPEATRAALKTADAIIGGSSKTLETRLSKEIKDMSDAVAKDGATIAAIQQMFLELISQGLDPITGAMDKWLSDLLKNTFLGKIRIIREFVQQATTEIVNAQEGSRDSWQRLGDAADRTQAALKEYGEEGTLQLKTQMGLIDSLISGFKSIQEIDTSTAEGKVKLTKQIYEYQDAINGLKIEGLTADFKYLYDAETDTWDVGRLKTWVKGLALSKDEIAKLLISFPQLAPILEDFANNSVASMEQATEATIQYRNETGTMVSVNEAQWAQMTQAIAQQLFNVAQNQGIVFQDMNGNSLTTVQQLQAALAAQLLSFESAAIQSGQKTIGIMAEIAKYMADYFKFVTELTPYEPGDITLPSAPGGGGQKKDPRAEALEKQIKAYEDEIELMQEQLEIYDEQIDAIDDLIEIENRKKEVIQDQIDIYEAQKDALDRQIDVLQQQIDLLDRQVEMLNRQTAEIDRQIEMYQREISLIDREIEMYERQKALIDELITAQEELIKPLEEQKDAIDKQLSSFKEAIDLQKEALQLRKEEADFLDELTKKNKALANLEAEIAIASLDTSEEGIARRLKLEEEAAAAREDLAKTQEDREYDLQVRGLDDAYAAFEKGMNAQKALLDDQIAKIQEIIDKYNTQKEAIDALIVPLEAEKLRIDDIIYGLEQQKIPIEDAIFRLEQEKIRIEDLIYPLEQQKIALDELIYPLTLQQEAIDLIIHQYEDEKRAIEDLKKPIEDNIELIGDKIEVLQDELDKINEIKNAIGGGGGLNSTYNDHTLAVKLAAADIIGYYGDILEKIGLNKTKIEEMIQAEVNLGLTAEQAKWKVCAEIDQMIAKYETLRLAALAVIYAQTGERPQDYEPTPAQGMPEGSMEGDTEDDYIPPTDDSPRHEGGFASKHGPDVFEGTLKDSEIFAKLLKGEYVATEDQMRNFLRKTLPSIASEATKMLSDEKNALRDRARTSSGGEPKNINGSPTPPSFNIEAIKIISPSARPSSELIKPISKPYENTYKDMNFEMNINVEGSLDKTVLPALKKSVIKEINKSLERRGIRRTADSFAI